MYPVEYAAVIPSYSPVTNDLFMTSPQKIETMFFYVTKKANGAL